MSAVACRVYESKGRVRTGATHEGPFELRQEAGDIGERALVHLLEVGQDRDLDAVGGAPACPSSTTGDCCDVIVVIR